MLAVATNGPQVTERSGPRPLHVQEERRRLARELHDGIAQELAFILGQSRRLAKIFPDERALADIGSAAEHALQDARAAIYGLHETTSPTLGAAIEARAQQLASRAGLELTLNVEEEIEVLGRSRAWCALDPARGDLECGSAW